MGGGSNGYRAALARLQLTPGLISSLPRAAELPPFISFSTSYRERTLPCDVLCVGLATARRPITRDLWTALEEAL